MNEGFRRSFFVKTCQQEYEYAHSKFSFNFANGSEIQKFTSLEKYILRTTVLVVMCSLLLSEQ